MTDDKPELSSHELIRQAREALGVPRMQATVAPQISSQVEGPSIQDLLATPLSSDSLLPQRAVDPWAEDEDEVGEPWEPIDRTEIQPPPPPPGDGRVRKRRNDPQTGASALPPLPPQPPAVQWAPEEPLAPWLDPMRDELGLPPAPPRTAMPQTAPRPLGPPVEPPRRAGVPWRFLVAGFIALSVLVGSFVDDDGSSQRSQVEVGDCFDSSNFVLENVVGCSDLHRVQVFAQLDVDPNSPAASSRCFAAAVELSDSGAIPAASVIPEGTFVGAVGTFSTRPASTFCYFESPSSGLIGSVLAE